MKKINIIGIGLVTMLLASCSTYQYTARQTDVQRQDITALPSVVDINPNYSKRIEVVSNWHRSKEDALNECRYIAIISNKIDVVVDPIFKIQYRPWKSRKRYQATLTGFAGYYTNQRTIYEDIEQFKKFTREEIENYLIFHNPSTLQYINATSDVINIYHENGVKGKPAPQPSEEQPAALKANNKNNKRK